jgi:ferredoxin
MGERFRSNAFGRYYVTDTCDGCGMCVEIAPLNFTFSPDGDYCAVFAQPTTPHEEGLVRRVMDVCPRACVADDGDRL